MSSACFVFLGGGPTCESERVSECFLEYRGAKCIPNFLRSTHLRELESPRQRI